MNLTFFGWMFILGLLYLINKTRTGNNIIYYSLVLILILLLVGNYQVLNKIMYKGEVQ